jgi:hypothetical protein
MGCLISAIAAIVLLVVVVVAAISYSGNNTSNTLPTGGGPSSGQATQPVATTAPQNNHKIGEIVSMDSWQVTIHGVTTSKGDSIISPQAGNIFLIIDITLKNTSHSQLTTSSVGDWSLQDSTGQKYTETVAGSDTPDSPDGSVNPDSLLRGSLAYEVPRSEKTFTLTFAPDFGVGDSATWNISLD